MKNLPSHWTEIVSVNKTIGGKTLYFIKMGLPGFNSPANNRSGYASIESALRAHFRYAAKGRAHRAKE